ncbi:glutamate-5-semialdehyde dehydrogenase [Belliella baltica DSM 15883]|uniref:Gamma-glutamyl phosphate reductase n=1 Tax=Belliella baltica (strain DSM 15883 / CIP 108006 / LMG 21964 / BA134) TaxID=866536 RepID=I3Z9L9_BELBD|nr:glutamate-5-semialdehyde dehydrogenase [Belliella baltica]AFL85937.1 glutamate-5-semialdehyde dehydrogenase [Belliella baltica DSM 15883]
MTDLQKQFYTVQKSAKKLNQLSEQQIKGTLDSLVELTLEHIDTIIEANQKDLAKLHVNDPKYDRLKLTKERIQGIIEEIKQVKSLENPLGRILEEKILENDLHLKKVAVPLGVIGIIYEARPNVTFDVFCIALKSGNGLILKGSTDAEYSNQAIMKLIHQALLSNDIPENAFLLLPSDRSATFSLLQAVGFVDLIIPRGSQKLIEYVRSNSKVPVIETGAGIVHIYFDKSGDLEKGKLILFNSKTRRPSVCNSLDCLIIHEKRLSDINELVKNLLNNEVRIFADEKSYKALDQHPLIQAANESHFGTEFLSLKMAIKTVASLDEALEHIDLYSSKHSEAIISEDSQSTEKFLNLVDAAAVYSNASTAFTDGNQFGMGAEIGISTQKLHARGPMSLRELTSYKWIIEGNGQIR